MAESLIYLHGLAHGSGVTLFLDGGVHYVKLTKLILTNI
jgi:hypothetical protein